MQAMGTGLISSIRAFFAGPAAGEWHCEKKLIMPTKLIDGSVSYEGLLCQRLNADGRWEYRLPTAEEADEFLASDAW